MAGPFVGGALITLVGWRSIFSGQSADRARRPLARLALRRGGRRDWRRREIDLPGQVAAIATLGALAGAVDRRRSARLQPSAGHRRFCGSPQWWGSCSSGARQTAPQPMLPLTLFSHRMFALSALVGLLVNIAFYGPDFRAESLFPGRQCVVTLHDGAGLRADDGRGAAGEPARRADQRAYRGAARPSRWDPCSPQPAAWRCCRSHTAPVYWAIGAQLVVIGGGLGLLVPPLTAALLGSVDKSRSGIAAGVLNANTANRQRARRRPVRFRWSAGGGAFIAGARMRRSGSPPPCCFWARPRSGVAVGKAA